jgi:hypothetical protein
MNVSTYYDTILGDKSHFDSINCFGDTTKFSRPVPHLNSKSLNKRVSS